MKLPDASHPDDALVLRTDFSDDAAWDAVCREIAKPQGEFRAYVQFVSEPENAGLDPRQLPSLIPDEPFRSFLFVVDRATLAGPEHPVLVVDLIDEPGRTFRSVPSELGSIGANLSIANMDFYEYADAVDEDGVYRGFPRA